MGSTAWVGSGFGNGVNWVGNKELPLLCRYIIEAAADELIVLYRRFLEKNKILNIALPNAQETPHLVFPIISNDCTTMHFPDKRTLRYKATMCACTSVVCVKGPLDLTASNISEEKKRLPRLLLNFLIEDTLVCAVAARK